MSMGRNALALLACRIGADLLNFLLFLVVSRQFGPTGMGEYGYGFALAGLVYYAATLGIDDYGIREYGRREAAQRASLIGDLLGAQVCIAVLALITLAFYLLLTQPTPQTLLIVVCMTFYQLGAAFSATLFVPAMAHQRMLVPAFANLLGRGSAFVTTGLLIWFWQWPLSQAALAFAGGGMVLLAMAVHSAAAFQARLRPTLSWQVIGDGVRALWSFAAVGLLGQLLSRIGVIVLALQVGEHAAGIYATGLKLVEISCLPLMFMGVAAYPYLSQQAAQPQAFAALARRVAWGGVGLAVLLAAGMYVGVWLLLEPLLGADFAGTEPVIAAMALIVLVQGVEIVLGRLMLSANLSVARAMRIALGTVICVALSVTLTPMAGIAATTASLVGALLLVDVLYALRLFRPWRRAGG